MVRFKSNYIYDSIYSYHFVYVFNTFISLFILNKTESPIVLLFIFIHLLVPRLSCWLALCLLSIFVSFFLFIL